MSKSQESEFKAPKKSYALEFWVGVFTLAGLLCFSYLAVNLAGMELSGSGYYPVQARFTSVSGLKVGAPLEVAGVKIGEVKNIELDGTDAVVSLRVKEAFKLRDDDIAQIRTKGIIGDRYIKISPGGSDEFIESGGDISDTESAVEFEEIIGKFVHSLDSE